MMKQIKQNIADCEGIIEHIRKSINDGKCDNCLRCMELTNLYHALNKLSINVKSKFPTEAQFLQAYIPALIGVSHINPYDFGGIIAIVNIVKTKCKLMNDKQRNIFISHSSKDRAIVQPFIDDILQLGIGIKPEQIFCTSIEDMGIKNGEDIRKHIHQNIKDSEFSFLLISNNYKKSEICLNEMGAVWAYDSNVKLYLLPTTSIDNIGWLCDTRLAERIDDTIALDALHEELQHYYSLQNTSIKSWSRVREKFIQEICKIQEDVIHSTR